MNHDDTALKSGFPPSGASGVGPTGGATTHHLSGSRRTDRLGPPLACTIQCAHCPWVDFRDYDQCGLTSSTQCHGLVASLRPHPPR